MYQLFVSAETDITSQIPVKEFDNRSVTVAHAQPPQQDSPNTELITGVTVSTTGVAVIAVIVIVTVSTVVCYRRKVQMIKRKEEQQVGTSVKLKTNRSYLMVTKPPVSSPDTAPAQLQPNPSYPDVCIKK